MRTLTSRCPLQRNYRLNNKKLVDNAGFERRDLYMKPLNNIKTKLRQKSGIRKNEGIELIYRGFI